MMKRLPLTPVFIVSALMLVVPCAYGDGNGDVSLRITNPKGDKYENEVVIGETNTLEIWIANDATLLGASWGFELEFDCKREWIMDPEHKDTLPEAEELNRAKGAFNMPHLMIKCSLGNGKVDSLMLGGAAMNAGLDKGKSEIAYKLQFEIPKEAAPKKNGLCIRPIFYPPAGSWTSTDSDGGYAPSFNGQPTLSETHPRAKAICFDIVKAK
jgi:hypothetical protein